MTWRGAAVVAAVIVAAAGGSALDPASAVGPPSVAVAEGYRYVTGGDGGPAPLQMVQGGSLVFVNADTLAPHTLTSRLEVVEGQPAFSTGPVEVQPGEARLVSGAETLTPGTYSFFCQLHSWFMTGQLEVVAP